MGQSTSNNNEDVDPNYEAFTIKINQFKVEHPNYEDLQQEFRNRFSPTSWNQAIWAIDEAVKSFRNNITYTSFKSAYHNINALKICAMLISTIPFCISIATLIICIFLLFWSVFLTATGTDHSFYIWKSTFNMLSYTTKAVIFGSYIITCIGLMILYFTYKTLSPLKKQYAQTMARHISANLQILNQIYNKNIKYSMEWIRLNKSLIDCKCFGECNIPLIGYITIKILNPNVKPMEDLIVMDAFMLCSKMESSQSYCEYGMGMEMGNNNKNKLIRIPTKSPTHKSGIHEFEYNYQPVEGRSAYGDVQTEISFEISVADIENEDFV